jgi:hypothetical protein
MEKKVNLKLKNYLTVGKPPIAPDSLDSNVFYFPEGGQTPILQPAIRAQIINDLEYICGEQHQRINEYVLVGDALVPGNKDRTKPLKVLITLNKSLMDLDVEGILSELILKTVNSINNRLAVGTLRKIRYIPTVRAATEHKEYPAIYNIATNKWIKTPSGLKNA